MAEQPRQNIGISLRIVAIAATVISVGSITALVIVATVADAEALSTIGMALAVIAFVAQLIQIVGQTILTNHQFQQTVAVNSETQALLAEIRLSTGNLIERRDHQFERLLESVVPAAVAEGLAEQPQGTQPVDVDELVRRVVENAVAQLTKTSGGDPAHGSTRLDALSAARPEIAQILRAQPASTQLRVWRHLSQLSQEDLTALSNEELRELIAARTARSP
jgi:hypothetical protein